MKYLILLSAFSLLFFSSCGKKGCTDPVAVNYNSDAKKDDGNCEYIFGCTDQNSIAFNSLATKDDGSCIYPENVKKSLVFKATATWCPPCGTWGEQYVNDIHTQFSDNCEIIALHSNDDFSVDVAYDFLSLLNPSGVPSFFVGMQSVSSNFSAISGLINDELIEANQVSLATTFSTQNDVMNIKVHSRLEGGFTGENCYLAVYIIEDGQVAPQQVGDPGSGVEDPNFVHNHILRTEASGSAFGQPITFENGENITEVDANLVPAALNLWAHENCYPVAVIWQQNGSEYEFINLTK